MTVQRSRLLFQPAILRDEVLALGALAGGAVERAAGALRRDDRGARAVVVAADRAIGERYAALQANSIALAGEALPSGERATIGATLAIGRELRHIGDYAGCTVAHLPHGIYPAVGPSPAPVEGVAQLAQRALGMLRGSLEAYTLWDPALAWHSRNALPALDEARAALSRELLVLGREGQALYDDTVGLLWVSHNFARIGVRAANVAAHTMFIIDRA